MTIHRTARRWAVAAPLVAACLLLSACGGDDTLSADPSSTTATAEPTPIAAGPAADPAAPADPADDEDPQVDPPTVDPPAVLAPVPDGAEVAESGSTVDCTGKDVVITEGGQQVTLSGTCTSVTVNASMIDLVGVQTKALTVAGDGSIIRFDAVSGEVHLIGSENLVTAPDATKIVDEGASNTVY